MICMYNYVYTSKRFYVDIGECIMSKITTFGKVTASIALASLMLAGCSSNNDSPQSNSSTKNSSKVSSTKSQTKKAVKENTTKLKTQEINLSQSEALNKFNEQNKKKKIKEIDLELENNKYIYKIDGFDMNKEYTVNIDANSGKILNTHSEKLDLDEHLQKGINLDKTISREEASKIAEKHATGTSQEWKLEQDNNQTIWEVKVVSANKETDVKIDAINKKVLHVEKD